jgi:hypothetical protein
MKATSHTKKRSVDRVGLETRPTGRLHARAVTARIERSRADDW